MVRTDGDSPAARRRKTLELWLRHQSGANDKIRAPKRQWGYDNVGRDKWGASRVEPSQVRGVKKRWA